MVGLPSQTCPRVRHIISGTFNTARLHLLAFDTLTKTLVLTRSIDAQGPHQFLALGVGSDSSDLTACSVLRRTVYATTWATPPSLSAWAVVGLDDQSGASIEAAHDVDLQWINTVPITATSSYVHVQPPPFLATTAPSFGRTPGTARFLYSAGGPTGELHRIDSNTGALVNGEVQELCFLEGGTEALKDADKGRKALRYGAHSIDVSTDNLVFVADLGRNAILTYLRDDVEGSLHLLCETKSPRSGDGPRHVVPSADGRWAFSVTEHTSSVDVFEIVDKRKGELQYRLSLDLLTPATPGSSKDASEEHLLFRWNTPTSGGKANAIEWAPRYGLEVSSVGSSSANFRGEDQDWMVLTDDANGGIFVLQWNGQDLVEVARTQLPGKGDPKLGEGAHEGASHAIWLT
ncbi:hypothetical protein OC846_002355 [Tilletia horrida]|uniref:Muconate cycloisomerase 1 n=1 Tax=Tilletia horrida TaxID=155126 RepID=A0AAN6GTU0_9BASI|nr:hypothetical protein OC846_002355 [Tilletia horrida]KAK0567787.1 hypothetical protein OC861_002530 [Tilletia horrida]